MILDGFVSAQVSEYSPSLKGEDWIQTRVLDNPSSTQTNTICIFSHATKNLNIRIPRLRESHAVILRDRVVPASQVPFPGEPSGEPGNETGRATLYRRNDSVGFFFSPVTIKLLQKIEQKRVLIRFAFVLFKFIVCYDRRRACATNY